MYYRIVFFDQNGNYKKLEIKKSDDVDIETLISKNPLIEIYRCNSSGNNYSHRRIYPN